MIEKFFWERGFQILVMWLFPKRKLIFWLLFWCDIFFPDLRLSDVYAIMVEVLYQDSYEKELLLSWVQVEPLWPIGKFVTPCNRLTRMRNIDRNASQIEWIYVTRNR